LSWALLNIGESRRPYCEARLNHALFLYLQQMAPHILTTGGAGGDKTFTEGGVAHAYLSRHGG
jgi:hypothetical protein